MEAIDAAVPVLGFPIFGDQFMNLRASQDNGIGIMSDIFTLNEDNFKRDVNLILTEKRLVYSFVHYYLLLNYVGYHFYFIILIKYLIMTYFFIYFLLK